MPITCSDNSYNMLTKQNLNTDMPHLQEQITQLSSFLEQINHKLDAMDESKTRNEFEPHNGRVHRPLHKDELNNSEKKEEDEKFEEGIW